MHRREKRFNESEDLAIQVPETAKRIQEARIWKHLTESSVHSYRVQDVAEKLDLSVDVVRAVMGSPEFADRLLQMAQDKTVSVMAAGIAKLQRTVEEADPLKHANVIMNVVKTVAAARTSLARSEGGASKKEGEALVADILNSIKPAQVTIRHAQDETSKASSDAVRRRSGGSADGQAQAHQGRSGDSAERPDQSAGGVDLGSGS